MSEPPRIGSICVYAGGHPDFEIAKNEYELYAD